MYVIIDVAVYKKKYLLKYNVSHLPNTNVCIIGTFITIVTKPIKHINNFCEYCNNYFPQ